MSRGLGLRPHMMPDEGPRHVSHTVARRNRRPREGFAHSKDRL